jgi:lactate dehydrogenase-like 2-hydroxyacid dehydrogenase
MVDNAGDALASSILARTAQAARFPGRGYVTRPGAARRYIGILGYGRIGQAIASRARIFGMEMCAICRDVSQSA